MDLTDEVVDKKIADAACQALGIIRNTATEINKEYQSYYTERILHVTCKLFNPDLDLRSN